MNRRDVLLLIGGGAVLAATAGGTAWYLDNAPSETAREPWRTAGSPKEYRQRFLSYALLAPNPHNRQPWLVKLEGDDALIFYCDLDRRLPATDPLDRQITLGCGAFLELLSIAAANEGYRADITLFPEGEPQPRLDKRPIAHVRFVAKAAMRDPAFDQILKRVTNRNDFEDRIPAADLLDAVTAAGTNPSVVGHGTGDPAETAWLRDHVWRAFKREGSTHATHEESLHLMRIGKHEVERHRDGIILEGQMMAALSTVGMISREQLRDPSSTASKTGDDMWRTKAETARAFAWLISQENTRAAQIAAGRGFARLGLKVAELGLAVHPFSHSLQEFPEMADLYREVHDRLAPQGGTVQMLVRVGYAAPSIHAPRRGLDAHLMA